MRILITGGRGYIAGRLGAALATAGHEVVLASRSSFATVPARTTAVLMDWSDSGALAQLCRGVTAVVQAAGLNARDCERDPLAARVVNADHTARLLDAAIAAKVPRFLYVSTAHVFGDALRGHVDETTRPQPRHAYATSHLAGENAVLAAHAAGIIAGIAIRLSNSFGVPVAPDTRGDCWNLVINNLCRDAAAPQRCMKLRDAGWARRDFIPMSEVCRAIIHLLNLPAEQLSDGLFNVGSGHAPTLREITERVASRVEAVCGCRPGTRFGESSDPVGEGELNFDVGKLKATGFTARAAAFDEELNALIACCAAAEKIAP